MYALIMAGWDESQEDIENESFFSIIGGYEGFERVQYKLVMLIWCDLYLKIGTGTFNSN